MSISPDYEKKRTMDCFIKTEWPGYTLSPMPRNSFLFSLMFFALLHLRSRSQSLRCCKMLLSSWYSWLESRPNDLFLKKTVCHVRWRNSAFGMYVDIHIIIYLPNLIFHSYPSWSPWLNQSPTPSFKTTRGGPFCILFISLSPPFHRVDPNPFVKTQLHSHTYCEASPTVWTTFPFFLNLLQPLS